MFVLYSQNYAARALPILFNTPKISLLKSSYPKKYLPNFRTRKNPRIENFKLKKVLRSSPSLEIPTTPPPPRLCTGSRYGSVQYMFSTGKKCKLNRTLYNTQLIQFARIPAEFVIRFKRYQYRMKVITFSIAA